MNNHARVPDTVDLFSQQTHAHAFCQSLRQVVQVQLHTKRASMSTHLQNLQKRKGDSSSFSKKLVY